MPKTPRKNEKTASGCHIGVPRAFPDPKQNDRTAENNRVYKYTKQQGKRKKEKGKTASVCRIQSDPKAVTGPKQNKEKISRFQPANPRIDPTLPDGLSRG